ncbi:MAG TPA: 3-methyl-2-oxobutanoate hydroxymethyltransferase [Arenimonas sp.]|uniref:3-methyl-2-oxobutanoate hydroxymethyltransferase n=1 Tax=Arenimonas sp. TaxID=1872635 RepID=UPI002B56C197|nr:3-methyl-2-oxobutanoate hydroxymethyltransferase [Arenimonas sp.]HMB57759.1 3-methyl-2-oxobutanoate hydroxymethyltransferase [Arenimonas sp.]
MYAASDKTASRAAVTVPRLRQMKAERQRIAALTAYDASFARALDACGVDVILVGDSLGMVIQGHGSTLPVTVDDIVYHSACVARGLKHALLIADMPFQSYATPERALDAAAAMLSIGGASMVKLEGAGALLDSISFLSERDIPVCAHLGLTPQSVLRLGGYKVQGREQAAAKKLLADARAVAEAGADLLVLECVPSALAAEITRELAIPTIGIGAGPDCDGQILVLHDLLGMNSGHRRPRFVKNFLEQGGSIDGAIRAYVEEVKSGAFPTSEHGYE